VTVQFSRLIHKETLEIIYRQFHAATFTVDDIENAISSSYGIDRRSIEKHVRWLLRNGYIKGSGRYQFVVPVGEWVFDGRVH
jgi:predicted transcriptional regulator